jgi:hypothetical protein
MGRRLIGSVVAVGVVVAGVPMVARHLHEQEFKGSLAAEIREDGFSDLEYADYDTERLSIPDYGNYERGGVEAGLQLPSRLGGCILRDVKIVVTASNNQATDAVAYHISPQPNHPAGHRAITVTSLAELQQRWPGSLCPPNASLQNPGEA